MANRWVLLALATTSSVFFSIFAIVPEDGAAAVPSGFVDEVVIGGLTWPTAVEFAPDGRVFIAERDGRVLMADSLEAPVRTILNIRTNVHVAGDRGLLGLALRQSGGREWIYLSYAYDAPPGQTAPTWGSPDPNVLSWEGCPQLGQCVVQGRISRFELVDGVVGAEQVLVQDYCSQFANHTVGDLKFGPDGYLYASAGDQSWAGTTDFGERGIPVNGCGSPPGGVGVKLTAPTAQGGSLVSQDYRTPGDPLDLAGTIIRIDPDTGAGAPGNPLIGSDDPNERRLIAYGLRNPFRFTIRPGTDDLYIGDVGAIGYEEIDVVTEPLTLPIENFGWPCYEGTGRYEPFDLLDLDVCESLYADGPGAVVAPYWEYHHAEDPVSPGTCKPGGSAAITGVEFYAGGDYPDRFDGALFIAEFGDACIFVLPPGPDGLPDPSRREVFISPAEGVVDLVRGPGGDLFYVDIDGQIHRVSYLGGSGAISASASASPSSGPLPLTVSFDASGSVGGLNVLTYAWDFDGDGAFDDATGPNPVHTFTTAGVQNVRVQVSDGSTSAIAEVAVTAGNSVPTIVIESPTPDDLHAVGDAVRFSATAADAEDGDLSESIRWTVQIEHCPTPESCHTHPQGVIDNSSSGEVVFPDHEGPYELQVVASVTDLDGATAEVMAVAEPLVAPLDVATSPAGLPVFVAAIERATPYAHESAAGSTVSLSVPLEREIDGETWRFVRWSDGATSPNRTVTATADLTSITAVYEEAAGGYVLLSEDGTVSVFGDAEFHGSATVPAGVAAVDVATSSTGRGYVVLLSDGSVQAFGDVELPPLDVVLRSGEAAVDIALTPGDDGFWIFTSRGRVFTAGAAVDHGDLERFDLDQPITAAAVTATGGGYRMLGLDGGVFAFGDAEFLGSIPQVLPGVEIDCPIVGIANVSTDTPGYWLVGCDGGVFGFGAAPFVGSLPGIDVTPDEPVNAMVPYGAGYLLVASDGGVFSFGAGFFGSLADTDLRAAVVAVAPV